MMPTAPVPLNKAFPDSRTPSKSSTGAEELTRRSRFLAACDGKPLSCPPIWMMRQAGRALPEYRALKERYSFLDLVRTPELAAEVTLQPIRRFDFDAAILFSDILVVPEAMGQGYHFREAGGIEMDFAIRGSADIERLSTNRVVEHLQYAGDAIKLIKPALGNRTALIGFAGSPWTLANFMLEGGSAKEPRKGLELLSQSPELFRALMEKLSDAVVQFLRLQIESGVDAIQIFDSHGGLLPAGNFWEGSGRWMKQIIDALPDSIPVILFSKGTRAWSDLVRCGQDVVGVDHGIAMESARAALPETVGIQGNLDPGLLTLAEPEIVVRETKKLMQAMRGRNGWIFNLGHGLPPAADLESISAIINTLRQNS